MKPFDFWTISQWLIENKKCAEGFRTSVSRSYYAAFHTALEFLTDMGITFPAKDRHQLVPDILMNSGDSVLNGVGKKLDNLKTERHNADYQLADKDYETEPNALLRLQEASTIIAGINTCRRDPSRYDKVKVEAVKRARLRISGV